MLKVAKAIEGRKTFTWNALLSHLLLRKDDEEKQLSSFLSLSVRRKILMTKSSDVGKFFKDFSLVPCYCERQNTGLSPVSTNIISILPPHVKSQIFDGLSVTFILIL